MYSDKFTFFEKFKPRSGLILITVGETHGMQHTCYINPGGVEYYTSKFLINTL
jgi:hypothetical protein